MSLEPPSVDASPPPGGLSRFFARLDDGEMMRWSFRALLAGAVAVLALDLYQLVETGNAAPQPGIGMPGATGQPILPPAVSAPDAPAPSVDPREPVTADEAVLRHPMRFELVSDGVLLAQGSIDQGAAARFAAEVAARGEYVRTIRLDSPGGSLEDAMAMARTTRERGFATEVVDGGLCASSCPLVLAGGTTRMAGDNAAVGLHQFFAAQNVAIEPAQVMADAQMTTARISRLLSEMDVDPALWLHALDTPPRALYYLSVEEMQRYRLVTTQSPVATR